MAASSVPPGLAKGLVVARKYELARKLGCGAMGEVWAARHLSLDEEVAVKLVMRNVGHEDGTSSDARFLVEARVAAQLSRRTRHIVGVTDHGEDGPMAYLVMELLEGESLDERLERTGPLTLAKAVPLVSQIARGLAVAHADGVVHRDLKPSNVFVTADEDGKALVKILDFGIAKLRSRLDRRAAYSTQRGFLLGTPAYMSPEQARGKSNIDHRADVWALAVIAYHLLTDAYPFDGESAEDLFARLCRIEPVPVRVRNPALPQVVEDFFERAFAERIDERFQSAVALAGAFEQLEPLAAGAAVSLPPPKERQLEVVVGPGRRSEPTLDERVEHAEGSSIFAAGVPRRRGVLVPLAACALVAGVLGVTAATISIYFEREPPRGVAVAPAATAPALPSAPAPADSHAAIPPPDEPAPAVRAQDLPPSRASTSITGARVHAPPPAPPRADPPAVTVATAPESNAPLPRPPAPARNVDRSEVF